MGKFVSRHELTEDRETDTMASALEERRKRGLKTSRPGIPEDSKTLRGGLTSASEDTSAQATTQTRMRMLPKLKRIALVAHDNMKGKLFEWTLRWREVLQSHELVGTSTTSLWFREQVGLEVEGLLSGPFGGDQQIGACIAEQRLDMLVFFWDPLYVMPHDSDVKALLRIATLYNIPIANNAITAEFLITSPLMGERVQCQLPDTRQ